MLRVLVVSKVGSSFREGGGAKTGENEGAPQARRGPTNYSEGKVPALSPRRLPVSAALRGGRRGGGAAGGLGLGGSAGRGRPASGWRRSWGASRFQGEALPHALGPPGVGAAGHGAEAAGISRQLPHWPARSRSLLLPLAHTGTHPTSPTAAAPPQALTCISLTSHLMAASGAGPAPAGGQAGAQGVEDAARDVLSARPGGGGGEEGGGGANGGGGGASAGWGGRREAAPRPRAARALT